jgi:hypothetical protein
MAISIKSLGLDRLGLEDRLSLVEELCDSIAADSGAVLLTGPQRVNCIDALLTMGLIRLTSCHGMRLDPQSMTN